MGIQQHRHFSIMQHPSDAPTSPDVPTLSPPDFEFAVRPIRLEWPDDLPRYWYGGDIFATHFMNALSVTFPHGEKLFIDSVRAYRDRNTDPTLERQIRAFIGQEGWHRNAHQAFNDWLDSQGLPASKLDALTEKRTTQIRENIPPRGWLAATVCLEHFTAIFAEKILLDEQGLQAMHPHFRQLWTWHALEELEHKGVAFDLFKVTAGKNSTRIRAMVLVTLNFTWDISRNLVMLLHADRKLFSPRVWGQGLRFLFGPRQGLIWRTLPAWLQFFRRDFHPWQRDDRDLIHRVQQGLEATA